jgi:hypothetical protein
VNDLSQFDHKLSFHENRGVDVAPFLQQLSHVQEDVFVKIHSKKSQWGFKFHINWREILLNDLIGSEQIFERNLKTLTRYKNNAVLCNKTMLLNNREFYNSKNIRVICDILNIDYESVKNSDFVAGNMFMAKTSLYKKYFNNKNTKMILSLLSDERGKVSDYQAGTFSHSMERIFGYIVKYDNLNFCHPKHKAIKILNNNAPNKKFFNLIITHNSYCYLLEEPNIYGRFIKHNDHYTIEWYHLESKTIATYRKINYNTIIRDSLID